MKKTLPVAFIVGTMLAAAQPPVAQAQSAEQPAMQHETAEIGARDPETTNEQLDELTKEIVQQSKENKQLKNRIEQYKNMTDELEVANEEAEFAHSQEMSQLMAEIEESSKRRINIYGFFDFTFYKNFFYKYSAYNLLVPNTSSFTVIGLNLYFQSELAEDVTFLSEIKFSYRPDAYGELYEIENVPGTEYFEADTRVRDPYTTEQFDQGGITIIRANLTYQPLDYFYIKVGRFITPYGIWNVDHGSPVVLPTHLPYMQLRISVPKAQTGLMVGGRVFPVDSVILKYALTLSNGRDPASDDASSDALFDTDDHKALGLRLKGTWQHRDAQISLGSYGYVGTNRKISKMLTIDGPTTDPEGKVPEDRPGIVEVRDIYYSNEYAITADFQLDWHGLRLQAEYVWKYRDYSVPKPLVPEYVIAKGGTPYMDQWYKPSHTGYDIYGLIAYALPLQRLIGSFRITPYYMFERSNLLDTDKYEAVRMHSGGLNMAPWPALVLKLEIVWVIPEEKQLFGERLISLATQMAVSF